MGADRPPAPSRGTRSVCAFSCRLCPECVEADGHPDGSRLGGSSAQRPARLGPVICPWRWGPAAAPGVRAGVRFGAAAPRFECRVFAPRTACNVDVHVKKPKKQQTKIYCLCPPWLRPRLRLGPEHPPARLRGTCRKDRTWSGRQPRGQTGPSVQVSDRQAGQDGGAGDAQPGFLAGPVRRGQASDCTAIRLPCCRGTWL